MAGPRDVHVFVPAIVRLLRRVWDVELPVPTVFGAYAGVRVAVGLRFSPALDVTATRATR